ncbi:MAG: sigma-54 dependent transcriptional regulator [Pseudomonadota bacterium]
MEDLRRFLGLSLAVYTLQRESCVQRREDKNSFFVTCRREERESSMAHESRRISRSERSMLQGRREPFSIDRVDSIERDLAVRAARSNCTILITGETGAGKGHLARWIHDTSGRADGPFVPINCGAIPESIIDSQLFGHVRGAFSGATSNHLGLIRAAENGTLLLDEISELPLSAQTRLLRLLQEREVQPVGQSEPVLVDVRVIAATNVDLLESVQAKTFREDLLFRLDVICLPVAPLRERIDEMHKLLDVFNQEFATLYRQEPLTFTADAIRALSTYDWPGNIRQLRAVVERLHVLTPDESVTIASLVQHGQLRDLAAAPRLRTLEDIKMAELERILRDTGGSVSRAAREFGVHRSTIYRWLKRQAGVQ